MVIMLLVFGFLPKQTKPCNGSGPQTAEWITTQNEVQEGDIQEKMLRVEEAKKQRQKDSQLQQRGKFDQEQLSGSSIYEEERILRLMEEQEIPAGSGKLYRVIPEERNDTVRNTGRLEYLPDKTCGDDGANCELIVKHNTVMKADRRKRVVFSNLGALHNLARLIAKPVYNWVIGTDNDDVMKRFTTRMLRETQFHGHPEEYRIASHAEGEGAPVWTTSSQNSLKSNPEQNFEDDSNQIHLQCKRNVKLFYKAFKERLKSVSLVITSLLTSLHDTAIDGLNKGFKVASDKFEKIINSSEKILGSTDRILEILLKGHHNIIVIVGAGTVAILVILVLVQTSYMIKLSKGFKKKYLEADKKIKEMQENWSKLEVVINSIVREINQ